MNVKCCECRREYDFDGNIYEVVAVRSKRKFQTAKLLKCPHCGSEHAITFTPIGQFRKKPIEKLHKVRKLDLTTYYVVLDATRIANATRTWQAACDTVVTNWTKTNEFIIDFQVGTSKGPIDRAYKLQWRNKTDNPTGSFTDVGTGDILAGTATDLVDGNAVVWAEAAQCPSAEPTFQDGMENEGDNILPDSGVYSLADEYYTNFQWALNPSNALDSKEYEFQLYDVTEGAAIGIGLATITIAAGVTTYTKTFTADGILKATFTKTFAVDAILVNVRTKTFTVDAILKATLTKTFASDALLQATSTKTFSADAILIKVQTKTFTADAILKATLTKTFSADALLLQTQTKPFSADAILVNVRTKTFSADAFLQATFTKTFGVDAILQATQTKTLSADALLKGTITKTFTADAILKSTVTKTFSADAILIKVGTKTFSVDALLVKVQTKTFTADAILFKVQAKTFTADALLQTTLTKSFSVDAILEDGFLQRIEALEQQVDYLTEELDEYNRPKSIAQHLESQS